MRYAWLDAGIEDTPFATATDSSEQFVFQHESGYDNLDAGMSGSLSRAQTSTLVLARTLALSEKLFLTCDLSANHQSQIILP